ncbi:hypothetical protein Pmar_PMAR009128, partial [Perkinsus marinus ATCC 50983]
ACIPELPPPVISRTPAPRTKARYTAPGNPSKELSRWDCLAAGYSSEGLKHKHRHHNDADGSNKMHHHYDGAYSSGPASLSYLGHESHQAFRAGSQKSSSFRKVSFQRDSVTTA